MWNPRIMRDRNLTIRLKLLLAFVIFLLVSATIWFLSYYNLFIMKQKLQLIGKKDNLFNTILEARRYEKNFLLTHEREHLLLARTYAVEAEAKIADIAENFGRMTLAKEFPGKLLEIRKYIGLVDAFLRDYDAPRGDRSALQTITTFPDHIRSVGKGITDTLEDMMRQERRYVSRLFQELQMYLFIALTAILILIASMVFFLYRYVNLPLKSIENAIERITCGDYTLIPKSTQGDEFERFVDSLNRMIAELNRRGEQLVQSEKMASLGTLTSGVAHELNNPLNNISTSLQILLEEFDQGDRDFLSDLLRESEAQVDRARDIVKALLEFSRQHSFLLGRVNVRHLVAETLRLIKGEVPSQVEIAIEVPDHLIVPMDQRRIQQALINLLMNAVQAMPDGGRIHVRAWENTAANLFHLTVQDTGNGIAPDHIGKIFDPFYTTKQVGMGSGLGLSVTHGIIDQHGGRIAVASRPGEGTLFTITLPLAREVSADAG